MRPKAKLIGKMFHRRLLLLAASAAAVILGLGGQLFRLAVVQGAEHRVTAERRLSLETILPTVRGKILDRRGRVLAIDRSSFDVAVDFRFISGAWALKRAAERARSVYRSTWPSLDPKERNRRVAEFLPGYEQELESFWVELRKLGGLQQTQLDRRLDEIKREVQSTAAVVWDRQLRHQIEFGLGAGEEFQPRPIREQRQPHVILARVPSEVAFAFRRLGERFKGAIEVENSHRRVYPWSTAVVTLDRAELPEPVRSEEPITISVNGVADHILGTMRDETWAADIRRRPFQDRHGLIVDLGGYRIGDAVGSRGLERFYEDHLRGHRGLIRQRLDTGQTLRQPSEQGRDLHLTLDIALQARIQAILSPQFGLAVARQWQAGWTATGTPGRTILPEGQLLASAAVVLDIQTAEILALVSTPTVASGRELPEPCRNAYRPLVNRAAEAIYPPGSIIKPLVLAAAVTEGALGLIEPIQCTGHFLPDRKDRLRCWIYRAPKFNVHGALEAREAIAQSCNIFFYSLADRLGPERLVSWYRRFGLGTPIDIGLAPPLDEGAIGRWLGRLPDFQHTSRIAERFGSMRFATISMGIGQGPVTWTPLHAANAYAQIARGGIARRVTLVTNDPRGDSHAGPQRMTGEEPELDERLVETILEGLRRSVSQEQGTGHHIRYTSGAIEKIIKVTGVTVWAKTGTAQAPPLPIDIACDGAAHESSVEPAHAWFVGLVGKEDEPHRPHEPPGQGRPQYAIAVVVENGGSGGRTAGPIANEIIRALMAEGYLPETDP